VNISQGFMRHVRACPQHDPVKFVPFVIGAQTVGWVLRDVAALLSKTGDFEQGPDWLALKPGFATYDARTKALGRAAEMLARHYGASLRGEMYIVTRVWGEEVLAEMDRSALPWFGVRGFGIHANGYVRKTDGLNLWIAERSMAHPVDPGKLDNFIGGGMSVGLTPEATLIKEAWEEAGVPEELARTALAVGTLNYKVEMMGGLRNDTLFIYDFELPEDFTPRNTDGEVSAFTLMPLDEAARVVRETDRFKFNCNLVIIDFMLRHGAIGPEYEEYGVLTEALASIRGLSSV